MKTDWERGYEVGLLVGRKGLREETVELKKLRKEKKRLSNMVQALLEA